MEAIGTLAGGIAHDFNNILGAIIGYAEMIDEDLPAASAVSDAIKQVLKAGHRAKDLVKQILAFSRQADVEKFSLKPAPMIDESIKMLRASLPASIKMQQDIDPEAGPIFANPIHIQQIVMNLCTNAFHAMEKTGGILFISLRMADVNPDEVADQMHVEPGKYVQLSIRDTGSGIAPEIQDKIFDPYFTTKEIGKGTGMGLAMVHGIVAGCNGFISLENRFGEGTVFHVFLPIFAETAVSESVDVVEVVHSTDRILFIDDETMLAELGQRMLSKLGYHVTVTTSSIRALNLFQDKSLRL